MTPTPKLVQISAWSYSRFSDYDRCPALAKYKHIDRLREPDNPAMAKGSQVHEEAAAYVVGGKLPTSGEGLPLAVIRSYPKVPELLALPISLVRFADEFEALRKESVLVEQEWAFDREWQRCDWKDWGRAWLRIKVDAHYLSTNGKKSAQRTTVTIIDYKTGREHKEHQMQRSLYALGAFLVYPDAVSCVAQHWYLEEGRIAENCYVVGDLKKLQKGWVRSTEAMLTDTTFAPRINAGCKWCHFRRSNNGPCVNG